MNRYYNSTRASRLPRLLGLLIVMILGIILVAACGESAPKAPTLGVAAITSVTAECSSEKLPVRVINWNPAAGATGYRLLRNGEQLAEVVATTMSFTDATAAEPGEKLTYVVRAANATSSRDSEPFEFTVPAADCEDATDDPDDDEDDEPKGEIPGPYDSLLIELRCEPFVQVVALWPSIAGATGYSLLQGDVVIYEDLDHSLVWGSAIATPVPGLPFEFVLQAHNEAGTLNGPITVPESTSCLPENALLAAGNTEVLMIDVTGNAWGWGANQDQVLGAGTLPWPKPQLADVSLLRPIELLMRNSVGVMLEEDGRVLVWGTSTDGRLGKAGVTHIPTAAEVSGLENIVDVAMGESHILAVDIAGRVWMWGTFLGRQVDEPELIPRAEGVIRVAAGADTAYALRGDGTVLSWGRNGTQDALGHTTVADFHEPLLVPGVEGAVEIFAAHNTMYLLRDDGSVANLGVSFFAESTTGLAERPELQNVRRLSIGTDFILAVTGPGEVLAWGFNNTGQLGRPTERYDTLEPPQYVPHLTAVQAVFAGGGFGVAVDQDGQVHTWGANTQHQLGLDAIQSLATFTPINLPEDIVAVETGDYFVVALGASGQVYSWGRNDQGQLGRSAHPASDWRPGKVQGLTDIVQVAAGENFALALDGSGRVHAWGYAANGALGDGPVTDEYRGTPAVIPGLYNIVKVAAGSYHAVALDSSGQIWTWGAGTYGALGLGDQDDRTEPNLVSIPDVVVSDIAAGDSFTLYLANDFFVGGFGLNDQWQLGNEVATDDYELLPVGIGATLAGLVHVFAGENTGFVVTGSGDLFAWGGNSGRIKGCCADGVGQPDFVRITGVADVGMVGAALGHALILDSAREVVYGIGFNNYGQLGLPSSNAFNGPEQVPLSGSVTHVTAATSYSALVMDGVVHVSGLNLQGRLGRAPLSNMRYPVPVDVPPVAVTYWGD